MVLDPSSPADLRPLQERLRELERRRPTAPPAPLATGWSALDNALGGGLPRGVLHEWSGANAERGSRNAELREDRGQQAELETRNSKLETAPPQPLTPSPQPLAISCQLARRALTDQPRGWAVWIGRATWPYPHALVHRAGEHDEDRRLLERSLWIDPPDDAARLWAIDEAVRCPAVAVVVADLRRFAMPATRRLQLAAATGSALLLGLRPWEERDQLTAAATRWVVEPRPSPTPLPRWTVRLLRCKGMQPAAHAGDRAWVLELTHDQGLVHLPADLADRPAPAEPGPNRSRTA